MKTRLDVLIQFCIDIPKGKLSRLVHQGLRLTCHDIFLMMLYLRPEDDMPWEEHIIKKTKADSCFCESSGS